MIFTYIIQGKPESPIKIGRSNDPEKRKKEMQTGHPEQLRVLYQIPGDIEIELQTLVKEYKVQGEWYSATALPIIKLVIKIIEINEKQKKIESINPILFEENNQISQVTEEHKKEIAELAAALLERFGSGRFAGKGKMPLRAIRGWIRQNYGDNYTQYPLFDTILDSVALTSFEAKEAEDEEGESISMKSRIMAIKPNRCFSDFFEENGQLPQLERAIVAEFLRKSSVRHIASEVTKELGMTVTPYEVRQLLGTKGKITATNGRIARFVGDAFEWWCAIQIGVPPEDVPRLCASDDNTPDLIWENEIYSFKWRNNATDRKLKWTRADTPSEWVAAEEQETPFHFVETNLGWGFNVRMIDVDPSAQELEWYTKPQQIAWNVTETT